MEMESEEKESSEGMTIDLYKRGIKKIERANNEEKEAVSLILDQNALQRLDNLDSYPYVKRLSLVNNKLIRMEGVSSMTNLTFLDISHNSLVCIEGLKDLKLLKHLNLSGNKIKTIDHLNHNTNLEFLDLSQNLIGHISDISFLQQLKELFLHFNEIAHLRQCEKNLPSSLEVLTLSNNCITDLNEISHLVLLRSLKELTFCNNPCLQFTDCRIDFNYRPFVKNWCSNILILDGCPLDDIECLKAEWLYSQGRGRSFRPGEHIALAKYLTSVCPRLTVTNVESEDEKKLRLILSKAQHHQQQLQEQLTDSSSLSNRHKLSVNRKKSGAMAERMVSSYHDTATGEISRVVPELMTRSLDNALLRNSPVPQNGISETFHNPLETATVLLPVPESLTSPDVCRPLHPFPSPSANTKLSFPLSISYPSRSPLPTSKSFSFPTSEGKMKSANILRRQNNNHCLLPAKKSEKLTNSSKNKCIPSKLASPKKKGLPVTTVILPKASANGKESSEDEGSESSDAKLKKFCGQKLKQQLLDFDFDGKENIELNNHKRKDPDLRDTDIWKAALCIQRHWRGYRTRHLNQDVVEAYKNIQSNRIQDYIIKVANDMEATKVALEGHRKLQVLQMQAINALWKKMVSFQPGEGIVSTAENKNTLQGLAETCSNLNKQVEELQSMMKIMHHSNQCQSIPISTQTEISAVHTPQGDEKNTFPYCPRLERPSLLKIYEQQSETAEKFTVETVEGTDENIPPGPDLKSETRVCDMENSQAFEDRELDREEPVCLTPACQEGKDLQSIVTSDPEFPTKMGSVNSGEDKPKNLEFDIESEDSNYSQLRPLQKSSNEFVNQQNECSFS